MTLQCPRCMTTFTIFDHISKLKQTCPNENCKVVLYIQKLETDEQQKLSIYEVSAVSELRGVLSEQ